VPSGLGVDEAMAFHRNKADIAIDVAETDIPRRLAHMYFMSTVVKRQARFLLPSLLVLGCHASAPVWYEGKQFSWTLPLVDSGENRELLVPAMVQGTGPHLFLLDPDASISVIDDALADQLDLYSDHRWHRALTRSDSTVPRKLFEVMSLSVGDLRVRNIRMRSAPARSLDVNGRRVVGILGGDLLSSTIVLHIDREARVARLALTGHQLIPAGAVPIRGKVHRGRFYIPVKVNGVREVDVAVAVARGRNALDRDLAVELGLPYRDTHARIVDATGTAQLVRGGGIVASLQLGDIATQNVPFIYDVERPRPTAVHAKGSLGQELLSRYDVVIDRDRAILWLAPRRPAAHVATR